MILKLAKQSGTPVDEKKAKEFQEEFQKGFDAVIEQHGKNSEATVQALNKLDAELQEKFQDAVLQKIEFPRTKKAWKELLDKHGSVMMCTNLETGEMCGIIPDLEF